MASLYSLPSVKRLPQAYCYRLLRNTKDYGVRLKQQFLCRFSVLFGFHSRYPTSRHQHAATYPLYKPCSMRETNIFVGYNNAWNIQFVHAGTKKNSRKQFSENTESCFRQFFMIYIKAVDHCNPPLLRTYCSRT